MRSLNLCRIVERLNVVCFFSLLLFLLLSLTFRSKCCIIVTQSSLCRTHGAVDESHSGSMRNLKCLFDAMLFSILPVFRARCSLQTTRSYFDLVSDFFTPAHICHVRLSKYRVRFAIMFLQKNSLFLIFRIHLQQFSFLLFIFDFKKFTLLIRNNFYF